MTFHIYSLPGGYAIGIPGEVRGLHQAWTIGGKIPWKKLFIPAIQIAEAGVEVKPHVLDAIKSSEKYYVDYPELRFV